MEYIVYTVSGVYIFRNGLKKLTFKRAIRKVYCIFNTTDNADNTVLCP